MLMEQAGTQAVQEKEYTFTTPLEHGLSYKHVDIRSPNAKSLVSQCWDFIEAGVEQGGSKEFLTTDYLIKKVLERDSDLWVSQDEGDNIVGALIIGAAPYPTETGIMAESIGGTFNFNTLVPMLEKFYRARGYKFFEMTGRKGWERKMKPLGYTYMNTTIYKRL